MYPERQYYLLQAIMSPDNVPEHSGYLKLSFISMYVSYVFNIHTIPVIFPLLACYNVNTTDEIIIVTQ